MAIVVQKYGGSSVADVDKLGAVADRIVACRQAGNDVVVIVSAMGKTTDGLLTLAQQVTSDPPRRELDMLLSTGERISMALLSMAVHKRGEEAISFTGSQSGIITNDRHFDARIISVRPHRVEDELARGRVVIVAGYQGMSYKREITTLGRGGSDTTALAMAAALGAERAEIYSDVDGVYTADPRVVGDAQHLPNLSYGEMQEMSLAGAKVLHAQAVDFARQAKIDIHARATFKPGRETVISGEAGPAPVCGVVSRQNLAQVDLPADVGHFHRVLSEARSSGAVVLEPSLSPSGGTFLVDLNATPDWGKLKSQLPAEATITDETSCISIVGEGLARGSHAPEVLASILAEAQIRVRRFGASQRRSFAILDTAQVETAVRAAHDALIEKESEVPQ